MASLDCQLDYTWNDCSPGLEGTLVIQVLKQEDNMFFDLYFEAGIPKLLIQILRQEGTHLIGATPSIGSLYKHSGKRKCFVCVGVPVCVHVYRILNILQRKYTLPWLCQVTRKISDLIY